MEDSCWCAMQARYIELRDDRVLMRCVQKMLYESQRTYEAYLEERREQKIQQEKLALAEKAKQYLSLHNIAKERNKTPHSLEWFALFVLLEFDVTGQSQQPSHLAA